jgi:hypothetical protein
LATRWYYKLSEHVDPKALDPKSLPDLEGPTPNPREEDQGDILNVHVHTNISGNGFADVDEPQCGVCGTELWFPESQRRGVCEKCHRLAEVSAS